MPKPAKIYQLIIACVVMNLFSSCKTLTTTDPNFVAMEKTHQLPRSIADIPKLEFVKVPAGCYEMGAPDGERHERPIHKVCVDSFAIGKFEITQAQWKKVMGSQPFYFNNCGGDCPAESVSWNHVQEFLSVLNKMGEGKFRLPTEAEWEYACRSGGKNEAYGGGNVDQVAWYKSFGNPTLHPVGGKTPNDLGVYDMNGNVWEWVQDYFSPYSSASQNNPVVDKPVKETERVLRGGSWDGKAFYVRCTIRNRQPVDHRDARIGFRLVREITPSMK
ncbi:formylglycine-generating enzyme family protein [Candidatus Magnetaquicoccus inordinatus]|uniref:formylglycine-generating enzyme family protein n=1 Tax=Candidatus Magnetaquicoccus inordinatus TaxID=2496818 RepID=UPI00187D1C7E|nr:formylglycine-generating enzyme family protein [Candidatus Magnetaquicoccus inordinatus]